MGEKKKKEASTKKLTKIIAVIAGILFVVLMVVSAMGTSWITSFATVKPGDSVVVDYTIYNTNGYPLITTDVSQYKQAFNNGMGTDLCQADNPCSQPVMARIRLPGPDIFNKKRVESAVCHILNGVQCDQFGGRRHENQSNEADPVSG